MALMQPRGIGMASQARNLTAHTAGVPMAASPAVPAAQPQPAGGDGGAGGGGRGGAQDGEEEGGAAVLEGEREVRQGGGKGLAAGMRSVRVSSHT